MGALTQCALYVWNGVSRRKRLEKDVMSTPLKRCLTWWQLTFFGIGQMAGAGVYVLTGAVAVTSSGPATFVSYILAGICAFQSALAYAEFGARCPKAGSAYTYAYLTVGELIGFSIGWNLLLEHSIGAASTARAWGGAINALSSNAIKNWTMTNIGQFNAFGLAQYPDFFALLIVILLTLIVIYGAVESMMLNVIVAGINIIATIFVSAVGFKLADFQNWVEPSGFMPFGFMGVISGAAMCFYAYVGYDGIAMAGEETKNPNQALPIASALSMITVMIMYVLMSMSLTLTVPFNKIDDSAPFAYAFSARGLQWASIGVTLASLVAITGTTLGNLFSVPRCAYSMAQDGLLFRCLAYVHPTTQTPVVAVISFAVISGTCALFLDLETLAEMVSLGTLMAAFFVSACVIILRYQPKRQNSFMDVDEAEEDRAGMLKDKFRKFPLLAKFSQGEIPKWCVLAMGKSMIVLATILLRETAGSLSTAAWWLLLSVSLLITIVSYVLIVLHEQNDRIITYMMPWVPALPALNMFLIACLVARLSPMAWARFVIWMAIGLVIYFGYGIHHSSENRQSLTSGDKKGYQSMKNENDLLDAEKDTKTSLSAQ